MRYYLNVPYVEKDDAKALGARWDAEDKKWYYTNSKDKDKFARWDLDAKPAPLPSLSDEQRQLVTLAKEGKNVLVDACIGSGKTTAIQVLCDELSDKEVLYLTYNRLLKIDAQDKIRNGNTHVQNYHGFAYERLKAVGSRVGISDLIQTFIRVNPPLDRVYDVLVLDEYQDIEEELAQMLRLIKAHNPDMQIIAVGDMAQKIYDKTTLHVPNFIDEFMGDYELLHFTKCFRLGADLASRLGIIWKKEINGVNEDFGIDYMTRSEVVDFLAHQKPADILCLGSRTGYMSRVLNKLEEEYPEKFNKRTVYASINDEDKGAVRPDRRTAIFTTFDGSKGLERPICVVFDFTMEYWIARLEKPLTEYEILRNIFCVAASRGKRKVIFVKSKHYEMLKDSDLATPHKKNTRFLRPLDMSEMFSFTYKEDVEACYKLLRTKRIHQNDIGVIEIENTDEMIDLSPCIGKYQEADFFGNYDIDAEIKWVQNMHNDRPPLKHSEEATVDEKILLLVASATGQNRYVTQVKPPFVTLEQRSLIRRRLAAVFRPDENAQEMCEMVFLDEGGNTVRLNGIADVIKNKTVYELKFVEELTHEHYLQCAAYMIAMRLKKGVLWNTKNNDMFEISIPDRKKFIVAMINCITKRAVTDYYPKGEDLSKLPRKTKKKEDSAESA